MNTKRAGIVILLVTIGAVLGTLATYVRIVPVADMVAALDIPGLSERAAADRLVRQLVAAPGVAAVAVQPEASRVVIGYDSRQTAPDLLAGRVAAAGYRCCGVATSTASDFTRKTGIPMHRLASGSGCRGCCVK